jgi:transposase
VRRDDAEAAPVIAPLPESLQQRCIAAPGLLAQIIVSKYCDHHPLYAGSGIQRPMPGGRLCRSNEAAPLSWLCYARHSLKDVAASQSAEEV